MKVILTGATGFIGSHFLDRLIELGHDVKCFVRGKSNLQWINGKRCEITPVDFFKEDSIADHLVDADYIIHIAGVIKAKKDEEYVLGNHITTKNMVSWVLKHSKNLKRFLHFSSLAVTGPSRNGKPVDETSPLMPVSIYGRTKMLAEQEVTSQSSRLPITVVRPPIVYGTRDTAFQLFFGMLAKGIIPIIGSKKYFSVIHVDDLIRGALMLLDSPKSLGEIYFISNEKYYSYEELAKFSLNSFNCKRIVKIRVGDGIVMSLGSLFTNFLRPLGIHSFFSKDKAKEAVQKYWTCSSDKIRKQFGFQEKIEIESEFKKTIKWYLEQGFI